MKRGHQHVGKVTLSPFNLYNKGFKNDEMYPSGKVDLEIFMFRICHRPLVRCIHILLDVMRAVKTEYHFHSGAAIGLTTKSYLSSPLFSPSHGVQFMALGAMYPVQ